MDMTLSLDADALREATSQAIIGTLTTEVREELLKAAVKSLLEPVKLSYGVTQPSAIQLAFNRAMESVAHAEALRMVKDNPTIRARIEELLRQAADKVFGADLDKLSQKMADSFIESCRRD